MRKGVKIAIAGAAVLLVAFLLYAIYDRSEKERQTVTCSGVRTVFADSCKFVTAEDIEAYLKKDYGSFVGERLDSVDLEKVERILNSKSAILKTEAYTTPDGFLNVKVYQREPVVRFQKGDQGFYADERGFLFPLQKNYASKVAVVDGNIPLEFTYGFKGEPGTDAEKKWLADVLDLLDFIRSSRTWDGFFRRFSVDSNGDLVLVPLQGKERIIFGKPEETEAKFRKIEEYYTAIVPEKGSGFYSTVNVKYNGQIVCRK